MKRITLMLAAPAFVTLIAITASSAFGQAAQYQPPSAPANYETGPNDSGFKLGADAGVSILQNFSSSRVGFPGRFSARPGSRADIAPEYDFLSNGGMTLGADFETGLAYNRLHHIGDAGTATFAHGEYFQVPFVADLILKFHPGSFVTPYIGGGGGGDYSRLRINRSDFFGSAQHDDEVDPAVQAMGGVLFRLTPDCELGLGYKWLAAFPSGNQDTFTHAVLATFNFRF